MGIVASDTFTHPDQSGWPTSSGGQTWTAPRGSGTYSIVSDEGINSANGGTFSVARLGSGTSANQVSQVRVKPADTTSNIGLIGRYVDTNNFYYGVFSNGNLVIGKDVSGSFTTLKSVAFSYSTSNFYQLKFSLIGTTLSLKAWQDGADEPANFQASIIDSSLSSGGYGLGSDATGSTSFDSLTVTDGAIVLSATCAGDGALSGTLSLVADLAAEADGAGTLTGTMSLAAALTTTVAGTGTLSGTMSLSTALTSALAGVGTLAGALSLTGSVALFATIAGAGVLTGTVALSVALVGTTQASSVLTGTFALSVALSLTCAASGTLIGHLSVPSTHFVGLAMISDGLYGAVSIGDVLVDQVSAGDVATGSVTIADQG